MEGYNVLPPQDRIYEAPTLPGVRAEFYLDSVLDEAASTAHGRQIFRDVERVKIIIPGSVTNVHVKNVDPEVCNRWGREYEAFKRGLDQLVSGTPLEQWPILRPAQVQELRVNYNIRTVEEVAHLDDQVVQRMGMGARNLRDHAKAFLNAAERLELVSRLEHEKEMLSARISGLEQQVMELGAQLQRYADERRAAAERPGLAATVAPGTIDPVEVMKMMTAFAQMAAGQLPPAPGMPAAAAAPPLRSSSFAEMPPAPAALLEGTDIPSSPEASPPAPLFSAALDGGGGAVYPNG